MKFWIQNYLIINLLAISVPLFSTIKLSNEEAYALGMRVWTNESGQSEQKLTWWNPNEDFPSMGIGHFIWFPKHLKKNYDETFPKLISYLSENGVKIPKWLDEKNIACPWSSKASFDKALKSKRMEELRTLLKNTISLQALFIAQRLEQSLPKILAVTPPAEQAHIEKMFNYISSTKQGIYALADYVDFKGEGISEMESHRSKGWGLKQVLQGMPEKTSKDQALWEFVRSAKKRLLERVLENPNRKSERRWLLGWKNRLDSYLTP